MARVTGSRRSKGAHEAPQSHDWICVARIRGPHGVKGDILIEPLTQDVEGLRDYKNMYDGPAGDAVKAKLGRIHKGCYIAQITGVADRTAAEGWKGRELYVQRSDLPALQDEDHYHADLIDMIVVDEDGTELGQVTAVVNHGAGDVLEIALKTKGSAMIPFIKDAVLNVERDEGRIVVDPGFMA